ncbi:MAG: hypothetical protein KJ956_14445, partial [Actinobacteria bacterium]|nr:hypothetical protein [Actinomycetota bacterium]
SGNNGFSSEYVYQYDLFPEGTYYVGSNPHDHHESFFDMTAQEGLLMMIVNGATQPDVIVWRESGIAVVPNTTYYFSVWVASVNPGDLPTLLFSINGLPLGTLTPTTDGTWHEFDATWDSGSDTWADVTMVDLSTVLGGNDFAIDNIVLDAQPPVPTEMTTWGQVKHIYR